MNTKSKVDIQAEMIQVVIGMHNMNKDLICSHIKHLVGENKTGGGTALTKHTEALTKHNENMLPV